MLFGGTCGGYAKPSNGFSISPLWENKKFEYYEWPRNGQRTYIFLVKSNVDNPGGNASFTLMLLDGDVN